MYRAAALCALLALCSAASSTPTLISTAQEYPSDKADRLKSSALPAPSTTPAEGATVLAVDPSKKRQTIEGFGGAFTDAVASVFSSSGSAETEAASMPGTVSNQMSQTT